MISFLKKVSFVGFGNFLNAAFGLIFVSALARNLSLEDFGKYAILTSVLIAISKLVDFGTNSVFVSDSLKEREDTSQFISLKAIQLTVSLLLGPVLLSLLGFNSIIIVISVILGTIGYSLNSLQFPFFQREEKYIPMLGLNFIPALIKGAAGIGIFFNLLFLNVDTAFAIFCISMLSCGVFIFFLDKKLFKTEIKIIQTYEKLVRRSAPAGVSQLINGSWSAISNYTIKTFMSFSSVGFFAVADKISTIFTLIAVSIFTVILPKSAKEKKQNKNYDYVETILISFLVVMFAMFFSALAKPFILALFGEAYLESVLVTIILIFAAAFNAINSFVNNFYFVEDKTFTMMSISVFKLLIFITFALLLGKNLEIAGISYALLISSFMGLVATLFNLRININKS